MRTPQPQLPGSSPEPPEQSLLPPFPDLPPPGPPVPGLPYRLPLPAAGPSFDDQAGRDGPSAWAVPPAGDPGLAAGGRPAGAGPGPADGGPGEAQPGPAHDGEWTSLFARALTEALAGSRPSRQIAPWTTEQARRRIGQLGPLLQGGPRPVVRRVLTSAPGRDVIEMTVIVGVGPRTRAIAVRLERARSSPARPGRPWVCTAIEAA
jgi:hypothetical protein